MTIQKIKLILYFIGIKTIYCSSCKNLMKSFLEAEFVFNLGECGNCDHNRYSILEVESYKESEE